MQNTDHTVKAIPDHALEQYYFHQGATIRAYEYLGVHKEPGGYAFRVWAPNADAVSVVGDFNRWDASASPMKKVTDGIWEAVLSDIAVCEGQNYKYCICNHGNRFLKADPYAFSAQCPPETASVVFQLEGYQWHDDGWMQYRKGKFRRGEADRQPISIYEVHLGSWKKKETGEYLTYAELASDLVHYVKQMGYTHIELMPVGEYPFDGSWGYQVCGYYAPTARFGSPKEFMAFIDHMHTAGIGVILDWVPAHFPKDAHGLYEFDGQPLYEYQGWDRMEQKSWGTRKFDLGREEVQSFLISNAAFWAEKYHVDGLRVDAVASMLYLDYEKKPGEWIPNIHGENKCLEAVSFFQKLNSAMAREYPDLMMIAEESTAWGNVTSFENGGLGFTMKWNMGWMNDSLSYIREDPARRAAQHEKLTFSILYSFGERYLLPLSHDEAVHGKRSLLDRHPGTYEQKFAGYRTFLTYFMTHPGKKLAFMGYEFGQFREWDFSASLEWFLLDYEMHSKTQLFTAVLNRLYLEHPCLWESDASYDGFSWIDADDRTQSIFSYRRIDKSGKELLIVLNFLPVLREHFRLSVPKEGTYRELFNTDAPKFGGNGIQTSPILSTVPQERNGFSHAIEITLPPLSALIFQEISPTDPLCLRMQEAERSEPSVSQTDAFHVKSDIVPEDR